jgi:hypothetical protein
VEGLKDTSTFEELEDAISGLENELKTAEQSLNKELGLSDGWQVNERNEVRDENQLSLYLAATIYADMTADLERRRVALFRN